MNEMDMKHTHHIVFVELHYLPCLRMCLSQTTAPTTIERRLITAEGDFTSLSAAGKFVTQSLLMGYGREFGLAFSPTAHTFASPPFSTGCMFGGRAHPGFRLPELDNKYGVTMPVER